MGTPIAVTVVLLQALAQPHALRAVPRVTPEADPVRVWRADSSLYVTLREPGDLLILHADAIGRIRVLFPLGPEDGTSSGSGPLAIPLPPTAQGNPATFVVVRSHWAFDFTALRVGATWNYQDALLLQPTAGDPLAALLEIADRVTDGRPYDYGVATYSRNGTVGSRKTPLAPDVCLSCVHHGTATAVAAAPAESQANNVDCSNASLTNAFCGVAHGNVSITNTVDYQPQPTAAPATVPVYVPYFLPLFVHGGRSRFERPFRPAPPTASPPSAASAFPIPPRLVVPSASQLQTFTRHRS